MPPAERREAGVAGRTIEVVTERYQKAREDYNVSKENYSSLVDNRDALDEDMKLRRAKFKDVRHNNCQLVRRHFARYLSRKGYTGDIDFEHDKGKLVMVVNLAENNQCEDVRQLSGGERSYTTLCLLLALGHVIESPFRIMDEYDVFMDEQTRKTTLNMLRDYALGPNQRGRQFVIITPHSLNDIRTSNRCRLNKMPDPERKSAKGPQQQTLEGFDGR